MLKVRNIYSVFLFLFLLLPGLLIPGLRYVPVMLPFILVLTLIATFVYKNKKQLLVLFFKSNTTKILLLFYFMSIFLQLFLVVSDKQTISNYFLYSYIVLFINIIFPYYLGYFYAFISKPKEIARLLFFLFLILFCYSIIQYIGLKLNISFIRLFDQFINNEASTALGVSYSDDCYGTLSRIKAVFKEPSTYSYFLVINIPIILYFYKIKDLFNIKKNKYHTLNCLFIILFFINFLLTQSPIFIAIGISLLIFYLYKIGIIRKTYLVLMLFSFLFGLVTIYYVDDFPIIVLQRVHNAIQLKEGIEGIIFLEQSLGTRIVQYWNAYIVFSQNILLGVGLGNMNHCVTMQMYNSPLPLTLEIIDCLADGFEAINSTINTKLLVELGIIPTVLYYLMLISSITNIGHRDKFLYALKYVIIFFILLSFYNSTVYLYYIYFVMGILSSNISQRRN